jgi:serine protease Do
MSNNNWYATEDWYAPLKREEPVKVVQPVTAEEPELPKKKSKKGFWAAAIAFLLTFAIVIGLCMPAILKARENPSIEAPKSSTSPERPSQERPSGERDADKPEATQKPSDGQEGGDMPEDWDEFFANYYQDVDTASAEVNIQRGDLPDSFKLQIQPAAGKELSLQELYEKCSPSIVAISGYIDGQSGYNWGTGVILSADGLILTNTHVIDTCDRATVTLYDDREFEARLIGYDTISDIAVLKIDATGLTPAEFGESASLHVGDRVAAIGNPLGDNFRSTLTDGIISAISRDISYKGRTMTLLQTNTALNEGNSGGALFNMHGQVVGITNMKMMSSFSSIEGIGFAIPSSTVETVVNSMVRYGEVRGRPSIGVTVGGIPPEAMAQYKLPSGLYITDVLESSDAWKQGVRPGDILTEVNHIPVSTTTEVNDIKNQYGVGDSLHFTIWRNGEILEFDVLLMDTNDLYGG